MPYPFEAGSTEELRQILASGQGVIGKDKRRTKFNAKPEQNKHGKFDSGHEARRVFDLVQMQDQGLICDLKLDKRDLRWMLTVNGTKICEYEADARFRACQGMEFQTQFDKYFLEEGCEYVADAKSEPTRRKESYRHKKNLMHALFGIDLIEM